MGALYIALTNAMPSAAAELAHDSVRDLIDHPRTGDTERRLYQNIIAAVTDDETESRPRFAVIEGGNSAA
jgi:hypothetical protein